MTPPSITVRMNLESVCRLVFAGRRLRASSRNPSIAEVQPSKLSARRLWTRAATTRAKGNEKRETAGADGIAARANGNNNGTRNGSEDPPLQVRKKSFGVECSHRIEAHGAQGWDVAGGDGDGGENGGYAGEDGGIVGRDTVKQAGHEMRNNKRAKQAYAGAGGGQSEALAQNHLEDIAPLRAQREANS